MHLKLPTLKYRPMRGDMIEIFKITHNLYDPEVSPSSGIIQNLILEVINTNYSITRSTTVHENILLLPI